VAGRRLNRCYESASEEFIHRRNGAFRLAIPPSLSDDSCYCGGGRNSHEQNTIDMVGGISPLIAVELTRLEKRGYCRRTAET
jgi:hypothetical protein